MINKELKKLSRRELVDIIYQLKKNEEQMQERIDELEKDIQDKRIRLSAAGSIADAATSITDVFSVAQSTADMYLSEISLMKTDAKRECKEMIEEAKQKVEKILSDGKKQYDDLVIRYKSDYMKWQKLREEIEELEKQKRMKG